MAHPTQANIVVVNVNMLSHQFEMFTLFKRFTELHLNKNEKQKKKKS